LNFRLHLSNLSCERDEKLLFSELSAQFHSGEIVQITGPNGAGKTSLLKLIIGIIAPTAGNIQWLQLPAASPEQHINKITASKHDLLGSPLLKESLLYFGHQPAVKSALSALENLRWYFGLNGCKSADQGDAVLDDAEYTKALAAVGLGGYEEVMCYQMSAGQVRRVALARLYLSKAPLWILDEPFTAIDKKGVLALETCIEQHARNGGLVLLTTHQKLSIEHVQLLDLADFLPLHDAVEAP